MRVDPPAPRWLLQSALSGAVWPAVPAPGAATALAILHQLEQAQWLAPEVLAECQLQQLTLVLNHAWSTTAWYQSRWAGRFDPAAPLTPEAVAELPLLSRRDLQENFEALRSTDCPPPHGPQQQRATSGSTGAPVRFLTTGLTTLYWNVLTLRDHLWHRRDLGRKLAVVRRESELSGAANWGPATAGLVTTGPTVAHSIRTDADRLLDWLADEQPGYLSTYPSLVRELARTSIVRGVRLNGLVEVRTLAESLGPDVRELCREAWGVELKDVYSASETGYLALQCPDHEHYHAQSESMLVEVLDDTGRPCAAGEVGRVVVTTLHNFAMPLIRYDIGDYAEVGPPCPCGRGLPVLRRILGRVRNMLVTADGKRYWPSFGTLKLMDQLPIRQHQFVQTAVRQIEARIVTDAPLSAEQEALLTGRVLSQLPPGVGLKIVYRDSIGRSASGKFEDFVSELPAMP